jgi:hypothetical protein
LPGDPPNYYAGLQDDDDSEHNETGDPLNSDAGYATPAKTAPKEDNDDMSTTSSKGILQQHEADLSQDAMASFRTSKIFVQNNHPSRHDEFVTLLTNAISLNRDPAALATTIRGWPAHQP